MNFLVGDMPFYKEYTFTDSCKIAKHYGLVLLPEKATQYQNSNLCCVITSKTPKYWGFFLSKKKYPFFTLDSFVCLDRKDLVPQNGLASGPQPRGSLEKNDLKKIYKILRKSLFVIEDLASDPYIRGTIIREWKKAIRN